MLRSLFSRHNGSHSGLGANTTDSRSDPGRYIVLRPSNDIDGHSNALREAALVLQAPDCGPRQACSLFNIAATEQPQRKIVDFWRLSAQSNVTACARFRCLPESNCISLHDRSPFGRRGAPPRRDLNETSRRRWVLRLAGCERGDRREQRRCTLDAITRHSVTAFDNRFTAAATPAIASSSLRRRRRATRRLSAIESSQVPAASR